MNHISCQSCRYWSGYCKKGKVAPKNDYKINSCIKWKLNFACAARDEQEDQQKNKLMQVIKKWELCTQQIKTSAFYMSF